MTVAVLAILSAVLLWLAVFRPHLLVVAFPPCAIFADTTRLIPLDDLFIVLIYTVYFFRVFPKTGFRVSQGQRVLFRVAIAMMLGFVLIGAINVLALGKGSIPALLRESVFGSMRFLLPFVVLQMIDSRKRLLQIGFAAGISLALVLAGHVAIVIITHRLSYLRLVADPAIATLMANTLIGQTVFLNANDFSCFLCNSLILMATAMETMPRAALFRFLRFEYWHFVSIFFIVVSAASRMGTIVCAWIGLVLIVRHRGFGRLIFFGGAGILFVVLVAATSPDAMKNIESRFSTQHLVHDPRTLIYANAVRVFEADPILGAGPSQFERELQQVAHFDANTARHSHNNFLFFATQYGFLVPILYLLYVVAFAFYFLSNALYGGEQRKSYAVCGILALSSFFLFGMTEAALTTDMFYVAIGVTLWCVGDAGFVETRRPQSSLQNSVELAPGYG